MGVEDPHGGPAVVVREAQVRAGRDPLTLPEQVRRTVDERGARQPAQIPIAFALTRYNA